MFVHVTREVHTIAIKTLNSLSMKSRDEADPWTSPDLTYPPETRQKWIAAAGLPLAKATAPLSQGLVADAAWCVAAAVRQRSYCAVARTTQGNGSTAFAIGRLAVRARCFRGVSI